MTVPDIMNVLKEIRKQKKISQETIASKLGISKSQYGHYETGKSQMSLKAFIETLNILQISLADFFKKTANEISIEDLEKLIVVVELFKSKLKPNHIDQSEA